mmetsp:Transcript_16407/g.46983  ORF Transcript_16407/g.46983 Transcript_16407/m.46983 type:complete len:646 (-) Transcript_16407:378-2315(-)
MGNCKGAHLAVGPLTRIAASAPDQDNAALIGQDDDQSPGRQSQSMSSKASKRTTTDEADDCAPAGSVKVRPKGCDVAWLNFGVAVIWPFVDEAVRKIMKDEVEANLKAAVPGFLNGICFEDFSLGTNPPSLGPVHVERVGDGVEGVHHGVEIGIGVDWNCNAKISIHVPPSATIGIRKLNLKGEVFIILCPLMDSLPILGGIQITMVSPPKISWELTGMGQLVEMPSIASALKRAITGVITSNLVMPNRIFIHWVWGREREIDISAMQYPMPEQVLRLGVVKARGLTAPHWKVSGASGIDPYAVMRIGEKEHKTPALQRTLSPDWGDHGYADFCVYSKKQHVCIDLFDSDVWGFGTFCDDALGEVLKEVPETIVDEDGEEKTTVRYEKLLIWDLLSDRQSHRTAWWPLYAKKSTGYEKTGGEVLLIAEPLWLRSSDELIWHPPPAKGDAKAEALLSIQLRGLRGLPESAAAGAVIRVIIKDKNGKAVGTSESIRSTFVEEVMDPYGIDVEPAIQRMVECMQIENKSKETIMTVSGLSAQQVSRILETHPSFHSKWNQSLHIPLDKPMETIIDLQLLIENETATMAEITLNNPFNLKTDVVSNKESKVDEVRQMTRKPGPPGIVEVPSFDLDMSIQVFGMSTRKQA